MADSDIKVNWQTEFDRYNNRVVIMYNEEGSGGVWISGDQAKIAEGFIRTLKDRPELKEWLALILEAAAKK